MSSAGSHGPSRSNVDLLTALGARVTLVAPPTLLPVGMEDWTCEVSYDLDEALALARPDAVMMLRVQRERMSAAGGGFFPSPDEYSQAYGLNLARRAAMPEHAIVIHPEPMNRFLDTTAEPADDPLLAKSAVSMRATFTVIFWENTATANLQLGL